MSMFYTQHKLKQDYEIQSRKKKCKPLTPFKVQELIYELVINHFATNDPAQMGYGFAERYSPKKEESQILIDIGTNWKSAEGTKRPAIFINRKEAQMINKTLEHGIGSSIKDSLYDKATLVQMPVAITCIAGPVGFVEMLADYVKYPFMYFDQQIQDDYCFSQFRLASIGAPQLMKDAVEDFMVELTINTVFYDTWTVQGDDLKLRTVANTILDAHDQALENQ